MSPTLALLLGMLLGIVAASVLVSEFVITPGVRYIEFLHEKLKSLGDDPAKYADDWEDQV